VLKVAWYNSVLTIDSKALEKPNSDISQQFHYFYQCNLFSYRKNLLNDDNEWLNNIQ
jgi:hypothetical protein